MAREVSEVIKTNQLNLQLIEAIPGILSLAAVYTLGKTVAKKVFFAKSIHKEVIHSLQEIQILIHKNPTISTPDYGLLVYWTEIIRAHIYKLPHEISMKITDFCDECIRPHLTNSHRAILTEQALHEFLTY